MIRWIAACLFLATSVAAQVRVDPARTSVKDGWWRLEIAVGLDAVVPYSVFTVDNPPRLVVSFQGVDWDGVTVSDVLEAGRARDLRFGPYRDGRSRLVIDLAEPLEVVEAEMATTSQGADLTIVMKSTSPQAFALASRQPESAQDALQPIPVVPDSDRFVVVIDPGHGGIDPGADRGGVLEADLMLDLGREVAAALVDLSDVQVVMTRSEDSFVPLAGRVTTARDVGADLLISLHADALRLDEARGASVYTLTADGGDVAATRMVERHERGDLLAGLDLTGQGDGVANVLMDLARRKTGPEADRFADLLVDAMGANGVRLNARPRRQGQLAVLAAADYPSVLLEAGFLSNAADRTRLADRAGRAPLVQAIVDAVSEFAAQAR